MWNATETMSFAEVQKIQQVAQLLVLCMPTITLIAKLPLPLFIKKKLIKIYLMLVTPDKELLSYILD